MRSIILVAVLVLWGVAAHAQAIVPVDVATISMSAPGAPRTVTNTLCATDGNDLVCDRGAYLLPGGVVSTTAISATALQLASPTAVTACDSGSAGTIRYNSPTSTLELCTGSGWQPMGVGIPAGTISAFASTTCPTGWSEYTAARGRFLRGIDNGAGNDPSGTRSPGATQADAFQAHQHNRGFSGNRVIDASTQTHGYGSDVVQTTGYVADGAYGTPRISSETRPKNVAVTFCQFNGTSNGWNNPLSGGSTSAAGSTGQVQYNTSGAFDASPDFTWTNGSKVLGVVGLVSSSNVAANDFKLSDVGGNCATANDDGRMFRNPITGRLQICLPRN